MEPKGAERRRFARVAVDLAAEFLAEGTAAKGKFQPARMIVLGEGGCFLQTKETHSKESRLDLKFSLAGKEIRAIGSVRYAVAFHSQAQGPQFPGMGIQFETLSVGADKLIKTYVQQELAKQPSAGKAGPSGSTPST